MNREKHSILGIFVNAIDYVMTVDQVFHAANRQQPLTVSALAVHGVMTGVLDPTHRYRLNRLDLVVPDGQPVRWSLNLLHRAECSDRVYGPTLMLKIVERAADEKLPIYCYGSKPETVERLAKNLTQRFPNLEIVGAEPSQFRQLSTEEDTALMGRIRASGARILFVGLGCPRQEIWLYEHRNRLPMPMLAVGAAFDFHSGTIPQAPATLQKYGLEWLFRLIQEPKRLWKRYILLNPVFLMLLFLQLVQLKTGNLVTFRAIAPQNTKQPPQEQRYG